MDSYYFSFKSDFCDSIAVVAITGINTYRQEEVFPADATYDTKCDGGHLPLHCWQQESREIA